MRSLTDSGTARHTKISEFSAIEVGTSIAKADRMHNTAWLGVLLVTVATGCGGIVAEDTKSLNTQSRVSVEQALAHCEGSVVDMESHFSGKSAKPDALPALIEGKWARCPEQNAQFGESLAVEISKDSICPLEADATGTLASPASTTCVPWKAAPEPFEGVKLGEVITGADFSADGKLFRACANPWCAVYVRID